jgi:16S rRNA (adenine1518-N6/adenine1519-N6)-dimethyltransferase
LTGHANLNHHIPRKRFGQHFLIDTATIDHIIAFIDPKPSDNLVEIGPGLGALTLPILKKVKKMCAIELDLHLVEKLPKLCSNLGEIQLYSQDALIFDFSKLTKNPSSLRIFGNLPYNISTPLLFHLLTYADSIHDMHFMLQKEVVARLAAKPHSPNYGRLSIMIQYHCSVTSLMDVPASAFNPPPKVVSAIVRLIPYHTLPYKALDTATFKELVKQAFGKRRKTLKNALKHFVDPEIWDISPVNNQLRPEAFSVQDYVELSNVIYHHSTA